MVSLRKQCAHAIAFMLLIVPAVAAAKGLVPCGGSGEPECKFDHLIVLANNVIKFLIFTLAAPLAAIAFAIAGVMMVTARGNEEQIRKAKGIFWYVAIGFIIALAAWLIVELIVSTLASPDLKSKPYYPF